MECYHAMYNFLFAHVKHQEESDREEDEELYGSLPKTQESVGKSRKLFAKVSIQYKRLSHISSLDSTVT